MYRGVNLTTVPFNVNNINTYGTKLADVLFTRLELGSGMIEPSRGFDTKKRPALDQKRVDLIKICYLKKVRDSFLSY